MPLVEYTDEALEAERRWQGIQRTPSAENRKHLHGIRLLRNGVLEQYFATSHWATPALWIFPLIAWMLYRSFREPSLSASTIWSLFALGGLFWTLTEYGLHRFVFHMRPRNAGMKFWLFMAHGYHHEFPSDPRRLVAPPVLSWPISAVIIPLYYFTAGPVYFAPLVAGTAAMYITYDWIHYYCHHGRPTNRAARFMKRFHMEHHFKDPTVQFGLSSPLWDALLGSFRAPEKATELERAILEGRALAGEEGASTAKPPANETSLERRAG